MVWAQASFLVPSMVCTEDGSSSGKDAFTFLVLLLSTPLTSCFLSNEIYGHIIVVDRNNEPPGFPWEKLPPAG